MEPTSWSTGNKPTANLQRLTTECCPVVIESVGVVLESQSSRDCACSETARVLSES